MKYSTFEKMEDDTHNYKKVKLCDFYARGGATTRTAHKYCDFILGEKDAYCPNCGKNGHYKLNCTYTFVGSGHI